LKNRWIFHDILTIQRAEARSSISDSTGWHDLSVTHLKWRAAFCRRRAGYGNDDLGQSCFFRNRLKCGLNTGKHLWNRIIRGKSSNKQ
jgi:hypothetical protein